MIYWSITATIRCLYVQMSWAIDGRWACHGKTCRRSLSLSYPKDDPANPSFGMTPTTLFPQSYCNLSNILVICEGSRVQFYSQCHTQKRIFRSLPANPSLGMTTTNILKHDFPLHGSDECISLSQFLLINPYIFPSFPSVCKQWIVIFPPFLVSLLANSD